MTKPTVYALGFFDGIHPGHRALLLEAGVMARELGARAAVLTFDVHPDGPVSGKAPRLINTAEERRELIRQFGCIEDILLLPFDEETMLTPWRAFLDRLRTEHGAAGFVVGYDFRFGYRGEGNGEKLRDYCREHDIGCRIVPAVKVDGEVVSSTLIRDYYASGDMAATARFLGHAPLVMGEARQGRLVRDAGCVKLPDGGYAALLELAGSAGRREITVTVQGGEFRLPEELSGPVALHLAAGGE